MKKKSQAEIYKTLLVDSLTSEVVKKAKRKISSETKKAAAPNDLAKDLLSWNVSPSFFNSRSFGGSKEKPEGSVSVSVLRDFSINYPIARACIDYLKSRITQLSWDIMPMQEDDSSEADEAIIKDLKRFFRSPSQDGSHVDKFLESILEDYLVVGQLAIEKQHTRGGELLALLPVDVATIKLRIDESGRLPQPPDIAFEQWIQGQRVAELTQEDLIFRTKNARPNSPFGLSPLESLIIQVQSALAGALYNYRFYTDSNIAEGFVEVPDNWSKDQIKEYQEYFDLLMTNPRQNRKIKFMPGGMKYTATRKPDDMAFERFELWLLKQTCGVFGVPPQDIGITYDVNKATGEVQASKSEERAVGPLVEFVETLFTDVIINDFGFEDLKFAFVNVNPVDKKEEAEIDKIKIESGVLSVDEVRRRDGYEEIGLNHYIQGGAPVLVEDLVTGKYYERQLAIKQPTIIEQKEENKEQKDKEAKADIKRWKVCTIKDFKEGRPLRRFDSIYIDDEIREDISKQLSLISTREDINAVFDVYLNGNYDVIARLLKFDNEVSKYL
jgi:HK97 family phage portal protein